jgi:hypothetical protein
MKEDAASNKKKIVKEAAASIRKSGSVSNPQSAISVENGEKILSTR